jgi:hypothetical protein
MSYSIDRRPPIGSVAPDLVIEDVQRGSETRRSSSFTAAFHAPDGGKAKKLDLTDAAFEWRSLREARPALSNSMFTGFFRSRQDRVVRSIVRS